MPDFEKRAPLPFAVGRDGIFVRRRSVDFPPCFHDNPGQFQADFRRGNQEPT